MKKSSRLALRDWLGLSLVLVGLILRLRQYLVNRSLWLDEAMLANNIIGRDFAGLFRQLDNDQGSPVGFLLIEKAITRLLGDSEYALRLFPFLAGCLALVLMFLLTRKVASAFAGTLALALFAFSPALIYYTSEVKQYSSDVAILLALGLLFLDLSRIELKQNQIALLTFTGALVIWFSHPALFIIAALGLALFIQAVREKDRRKIINLLIVAATWGLSLAALYFINLRQLSTHQFFLDFWREGFLPHDFSAFCWLAYSLYAPFTDLLGLRIPYIIPALLFLIGLVGLTRRLPRFGLFLLLIFFLTLVASFLTLYPFAGRMILFLAPVLILLLAEGTSDLTGFIGHLIGKASSTKNDGSPQVALWKPVRFLILLALSAALLFGPVNLAYENFTAPKMREHIRPALETLRGLRKDSDLIYIYHWTEHAVRFYAPKYEIPLSDFIFGADHHDQPELYHAELDALRGHGRVWFLFSHVYEDGDFNERDYILNYLDSIGELSREVRFPSTSVYLYLYDLR
jgi:hypothetical protein